MLKIFNKIYDGESIVDLSRDIDECLDPCYNEVVQQIPQDEYGFHRGAFRVIIEWQDDQLKID